MVMITMTTILILITNIITVTQTITMISATNKTHDKQKHVNNANHNTHDNKHAGNNNDITSGFPSLLTTALHVWLESAKHMSILRANILNK